MLVRSVAVVAGMLLLGGGVQAQPAKPGNTPPPKDAPKAPPPKDAPKATAIGFTGDKLSAEEPTQKDINDFNRLVRGNNDPPVEAARRKEVTAKVVQWFIHRLTWPEIQEGRPDTKITMRELVDTILTGPFQQLSTRPTDDKEEQDKRARQRAYQQELRLAALPMIREVLKNRALIARINAARILHRMAEQGHEDVIVDLLAILEHPQEHDAVRYWAVVALGEIFDKQDKPAKDPKQIERAALAVYGWLDARTKLKPEDVSQLNEAEKDGIRFIRRGAIRALGNLRRPMIVETKDSRQGPVAGLLIRIMNNEENGLAPNASWPERVDAALALCKLQAKFSPSYQPEYTVYQVAAFIQALDQLAIADQKRETQRWQYYASELKAATDQLAADVGTTANSPANALMKKLNDRINRVLNHLYDEKLEQTSGQNLRETLNENPPKAAAVYSQPVG